MKLSQLPLKLAKEIFQSQIAPILLYGSEIWGSYMDLECATWNKNKIERVQTQFLKQILGCNYQTSNNMVRADTGSRPLINAIIKRFISYIKTYKPRNHSYVTILLSLKQKIPNCQIFIVLTKTLV